MEDLAQQDKGRTKLYPHDRMCPLDGESFVGIQIKGHRYWIVDRNHCSGYFFHQEHGTYPICVAGFNKGAKVQGLRSWSSYETKLELWEQITTDSLFEEVWAFDDRRELMKWVCEGETR